MRFQCPYCKSILDIDDCQPGELVACGQCGKAVAVPNSVTSAGALLGDFVIIKEIGIGGMGTVFLAHQVSLDRDVAIKVLLPNFSEDTSFIQDFINEARSAASVNHPNIVQAYAVNSDQGLFYFAMEFVDGLTLNQMIEKDGPMSSEKALAIASDMVAALSYAWKEKKLVHRDIKPDNIMINSVGQTKLADLGLARKITETNEDGSSELFGTPQYIAPELIFGLQPNAQSDIYSLGGTLYHILSGKVPYTSENPEDIVNMHLFTPLTPILQLAPNTPPELAALIESMMAKRPCHRYKDYDELEADLKLVMKGGMPKRMPDADAQVPIDINSPDPMAVPVKTPASASQKAAQGKIVFGTGKAKLTGSAPKVKLSSASQTTMAPAGPETPQEDSSPHEELGEAPKSKTKLIIIAAAVLVLLIAGGGAFMFLRGSEGKGESANGVSTQDATSSDKKELDALQALITQNQDQAAILNEIKRLLPRFAPPNPLAQEFIKVTGAIVEADLENARKEPFAQLTSKWEQGVIAAKVMLERKKAEEEKKAAEAKEKEEQEALKAKAEAEAKAKAEQFEAKKTEIRTELLTAANEQNYSKARLLFAHMEASNNPAEKEWAKNWLTVLDKVEKFHNSVRNSGKKYAGVSIPVLGKKGEWKIEDITFDSIKVSFTRIAIRKGKEVEDVQKEMIDLKTLLHWQLLPLAKAYAEKEPDSGEEPEKLAYLYQACHGANLNQAKEKLLSLGGNDFMVDEIDKLDSNAFFTVMIESMKNLSQQEAYNLANILNSFNKTLYEEKQTEISELIKGLKKE